MAFINGTSRRDFILPSGVSVGVTGGVPSDDDDEINGYGGRDEINGGGGNDAIDGGSASDLLFGGAGDDNIAGAEGNDTVDGGEGRDTAQYYSTDADMHVNLALGVARSVETGRDTLISIEGVSTYGGNDRIFGSDGDNHFLSAGGGNDTISAGAGNDQLYGGEGDNLLVGGAGDDTIAAGELGNDTINGGDGEDVLFFFGTADVSVDLASRTASQGAGDNDVVVQIEVIQGAAGNDTLLGRSVDEEFYGGNGNDNLNGRGGDDVLVGGGGNDLLEGGGGDDFLSGGDGEDRIIGGVGADALLGGAGADVFVYLRRNESGPDALTRDSLADFDGDEDRIDLSAIDADLRAGNGATAFTFAGTEFTGAGAELRFADSPFGVLLQADYDGDLAADFEIIVLSQTIETASSDWIIL
jgi:Ca2+-binding RTX toxin-like protein